MKRIAKFEKVSFDQFKEAVLKNISFIKEEQLQEIYDNIKLPKRATAGSAGYDFFVPFDIELDTNSTLCIPTGIRCKIEDGWVLKIYPRSGLGFKFRMQLDNTVGIIDSDYYYSDNEGHIMIKVTNDSIKLTTLKAEQGKGFAQGIFVEYGITEDDDCTDIRNGGFGSTDKK